MCRLLVGYVGCKEYVGSDEAMYMLHMCIYIINNVSWLFIFR